MLGAGSGGDKGGFCSWYSGLQGLSCSPWDWGLHLLLAEYLQSPPFRSLLCGLGLCMWGRSSRLDKLSDCCFLLFPIYLFMSRTSWITLRIWLTKIWVRDRYYTCYMHPARVGCVPHAFSTSHTCFTRLARVLHVPHVFYTSCVCSTRPTRVLHVLRVFYTSHMWFMRPARVLRVPHVIDVSRTWFTRPARALCIPHVFYTCRCFFSRSILS